MSGTYDLQVISEEESLEIHREKYVDDVVGAMRQAREDFSNEFKNRLASFINNK